MAVPSITGNTGSFGVVGERIVKHLKEGVHLSDLPRLAKSAFGDIKDAVFGNNAKQELTKGKAGTTVLPLAHSIETDGGNVEFEAAVGITDLGVEPETGLTYFKDRKDPIVERQLLSVYEAGFPLSEGDRASVLYVSGPTTIDNVPNNGFWYRKNGEIVEATPMKIHKGTVGVDKNSRLQILPPGESYSEEMQFEMGCSLFAELDPQKLKEMSDKEIMDLAMRLCSADGNKYWFSSRDLMGFLVKTEGGRVMHLASIFDPKKIKKDKIPVPPEYKTVYEDEDGSFVEYGIKSLDPLRDSPVYHLCNALKAIKAMAGTGVISETEMVKLVGLEENDPALMLKFRDMSFNITPGAPMFAFRVKKENQDK